MSRKLCLSIAVLVVGVLFAGFALAQSRVDPTFTFSTDAGGATWQCSVDGKSYTTCSSPQSYSLAAGKHTVTLRATFTVATAPPSNTTLPVISGTPQQGDTLTVSNGSWTGSPTSYAYSWSDGATGASDTLTAADVGKTVTATVTATNSAGSTSATTASVGPVTASGGGGGGTGGGVSAAFDLGWDPVGASAPFGSMSQDILFALQTKNGSGLDTSLLSAVPSASAWVSAVHAGGNKAWITIGGSSDQNWQNACASTNQAGFVSNLVNYATSNGFDGIDIDQEDDVISAENAPVALWTGCAEAIISAAHAAHLLVSEDVITNWQGPWLQPYATSLDQINLMTYGDTCSSATSCPSFASDVSATVSQLCPSGGACNANVESKFMLGLDMVDNPGTESSCGFAAAYARTEGYLGAFDWVLASDSSYACQKAIAANG